MARRANQSANILNLFEGMAKYNTLGLVWFDKDQSQQAVPQGDPAEHQDWRIEGDPLGEAAFRFGVSDLTLVSTPYAMPERSRSGLVIN